MSDFTSNDLNGLMEAYLEIYEAPDILSRLGSAYMKGVTGYGTPDQDIASRGVNLLGRTSLPGMVMTASRALSGDFGQRSKSQAPLKRNIPTTNTQQQRPTSSPSGGAAPRQAPSSVVLAKQGGVEGRLDKATGKFTAGAFSAADTARYAKFSPSTSASTGTSPTAPAPTTTAARPPIASPTAPTGFQLANQGVNVSRVAGLPTPASTGTSPTAPAPTTTAVRPPIAPVTPNRAITAAPSSSPTASGSVVPVTNRIAASPTPIPTTTSNIKKPLNQSFDIFDIIKGHLLDEGYADTEEAALAIMTNMSEEWKEEILEGFQTVSDNAAEAMRRREASLRPGAYPGQDTTDNWRKSIKMRDGLYKTGVTPI